MCGLVEDDMVRLLRRYYIKGCLARIMVSPTAPEGDELGD